MLGQDLFDYIPGPEHPAKRERPRNIARLYVHKAEWKDLDTILSRHGETHIVDVRPVPIIPAIMVEVLCRDSHSALALMVDWVDYGNASPHRPHNKEKAEEWGKQFAPYGEIPPNWRF